MEPCLCPGPVFRGAGGLLWISRVEHLLSPGASLQLRNKQLLKSSGNGTGAIDFSCLFYRTSPLVLSLELILVSLIIYPDSSLPPLSLLHWPLQCLLLQNQCTSTSPANICWYLKIFHFLCTWLVLLAWGFESLAPTSIIPLKGRCFLVHLPSQPGQIGWGICDPLR